MKKKVYFSNLERDLYGPYTLESGIQVNNSSPQPLIGVMGLYNEGRVNSESVFSVLICTKELIPVLSVYKVSLKNVTSR